MTTISTIPTYQRYDKWREHAVKWREVKLTMATDDGCMMHDIMYFVYAYWFTAYNVCAFLILMIYVH